VTSRKWKAIWKQELKNNPHLFKTKALKKRYGDRKQALVAESRLQRALIFSYMVAYLPAVVALAGSASVFRMPCVGLLDGV
jgi:hypothetical protein